MPTVRVLTWNVCGDKQARADLALKVINSDSPDILFFQEARKTKPQLSNLYTALKASSLYDFLFCDEYEPVGIPYGKQNYYPDTSGKSYYCFYKKATITKPQNAALQLVDYVAHLSTSGKDPNANLLTTRRPAYIEIDWTATNQSILLFTWHAPLSGAGGGVFNYQAHAFFNSIAEAMSKNKVAIIAGDMNATAKQVAKTYSNDFEVGGYHLSHIVTNQTIAQSSWYDDVLSDVHYLLLADISWT